MDNGIDDLVILEASDRIGGRVCKENFGGVSVELGAGWIVGVGGKEPNPVWELALKSSLRTCFSDYSNARYNIYDRRFEFLILIDVLFVFRPISVFRMVSFLSSAIFARESRHCFLVVLNNVLMV